MFLPKFLSWLVPLAFLRLSFGDGGDSTQQSSTDNSTKTTVTDRRVVADGGSPVLGDGSSSNTITVTDLDAIKAGTDLATAAVVGATQLATKANADANALGASSLDLGKTVIGELKGAYATANEQAQDFASGNRTLAVTGLVVAGILAMALLQRQGKK